MRRVLLALILGAAPLAAQTPAAPALAAAAPAADSVKGPRRSPVYMMLMLEVHGTRLITGEAGTGAQTEPGMGSFDFSIQSSRKSGVGLAFRSIGGEEAYDYAELGVLLGKRAFSFDLGAATRTGYNTFSDALNDTTYTFARIGARSRMNLGASDFSLTFRGLGYVKIPSAREELMSSDLSGMSLETGLTWAWSRFPLAASLGYRLEKFHVFGVEQESSSLTLGGGILLGRR